MENRKFYFTKISGRIGNIPVTAFVYPECDFQLSYYVFNGKTYVGQVEFTEIFNEEQIEY